MEAPRHPPGRPSTKAYLPSGSPDTWPAVEVPTTASDAGVCTIPATFVLLNSGSSSALLAGGLWHWGLSPLRRIGLVLSTLVMLAAVVLVVVAVVFVPVVVATVSGPPSGRFWAQPVRVGSMLCLLPRLCQRGV